MGTVIRTFVALWYLFGWTLHVYLALMNPEIYRPFGDTALVPGYSAFWGSFVMPRITFFALLLSAFEIVVGWLLISRGRLVKIGLVFSLLFNSFLVQMGLSYSTPAAGADFLVNRLPNLVLIGLQVPLLFGSYPHSVPYLLRERLLPKHRD